MEADSWALQVGETVVSYDGTTKNLKITNDPDMRISGQILGWVIAETHAQKQKQEMTSIDARAYWGEAINAQRMTLPSDLLVTILQQESKETVRALQEIARNHQAELSETQVCNVLLGRESLPFDDDAVYAQLWHQREVQKPTLTRVTARYLLSSHTSGQLRMTWIYDDELTPWLAANAVERLNAVLPLVWAQLLTTPGQYTLPLKTEAEHLAALGALDQLIDALRLEAFTRKTEHLHCFDLELHLKVSALEADQLLASECPAQWPTALQAIVMGAQGIVQLTARPSLEQLQTWEQLITAWPVQVPPQWWQAPEQSTYSFAALIWAASWGDFYDYAQMRRAQLLKHLSEPLDAQALEVINQRTQRLLNEFQQSIEVHRKPKWFKLSTDAAQGTQLGQCKATLELESGFADWLQGRGSTQLKAALGKPWQVTGRAHRQLLGDIELELDALFTQYKA